MCKGGVVMPEKHICPLCGSEHCTCIEGQNGYNGYQCFQFNPDNWIYISDNLLLNEAVEIREKCLDLICEKVIREPYCQIDNMHYKWQFYYNTNQDVSSYENQEKNYINLAYLLPQYPKTFIEKTHRALLNLSFENPYYGDIFAYNDLKRRLLFQDKGNNIVCNDGMLGQLFELGYLSQHSSHQYYISASGWQKIDELQKKNNEVRQGFIAMRFGNETKSIRKAFRKAIFDSGYAVRVIDEKEHNNQIVPEIFYEIGRSKFVVVDVTYPNYGAYYEAGYAQALGKQVIVCCRKKEFDDSDTKPHFDIAQKSMIVWENEDDLIARLKRRIEATVE